MIKKDGGKTSWHTASQGAQDARGAGKASAGPSAWGNGKAAPRARPARPSAKEKPKAEGNGNSNPRTRGLRPPWKKGDVPNPAGRPKGSRHKLSEKFIRALHDDFERHGDGVIEAVRSEAPAEYLRIIAGIVPKQFGIEEGTSQNAFLECWRAISEGRA